MKETKIRTKRFIFLIGIILILAILLIVILYVNNKPKNDINVCKIDSDCETPAEYAVQSNCPFMSICKNQKCLVVCPTLNNLYPQEKNSSIVSKCNTNSDCNCSWRGNRSMECLCYNNKCYSVEG